MKNTNDVCVVVVEHGVRVLLSEHYQRSELSGVGTTARRVTSSTCYRIIVTSKDTVHNSTMNDEISNDDSDIELDGVDMEDDEDIDEQKSDQVFAECSANTVAAATAKNADEDIFANALATKEAAELDAARKERLELIKEEQEALKVKGQEATDPQSRLEYLLHQSDVFAHFLAGSIAAAKKKKGGKGKSAAETTKGNRSGRQQRLTEEEEDEQLLKSAQSERHSVVRLHHQPKILAPVCNMHPYQLEGLNWLIKLHDHGINGILADGTSKFIM